MNETTFFETHQENKKTPWTSKNKGHTIRGKYKRTKPVDPNFTQTTCKPQAIQVLKRGVE